MNDKLQEKLDKYYTPYVKRSSLAQTCKLNFDDVNSNIFPENTNKVFEENAHQKWRVILGKILNGNSDELREFLKSINPSLYVKLNHIGQQYFMKEFKVPNQKVSFPDIENPKLDSEDTEEIKIESDFLDEGIRMLKRSVRNKIIGEGFTIRESSKNIMANSKSKTDIITPLVLLMRGNKEILLKRNEILKNTLSGRNTKNQNRVFRRRSSLVVLPKHQNDRPKIETNDTLEKYLAESKFFEHSQTPRVKSKYMLVHSSNTPRKQIKVHVHPEKATSRLSQATHKR